MSNSSLVTYTKLSPHCESRDGVKITDITIHHMAAVMTVQQCGEVFQTREASSNYGCDPHNIALYVDESKASWANGNMASNRRSITIELANDEAGGQWHVADSTILNCIKLCADVCYRNGIDKLIFTGDSSGNLTQHNFFMATACPGPYLKTKFKYIADEVNKRLKGGWIFEGNQWHYYKNGLAIKNRWARDKIGWCWLGSDGNIVKKSWIKYKGTWYYLKPDGYMAVNQWQQDKTGQWCYLGPDGKQVCDKWLIWKNNIYYIKPDGYMAVGEHDIKCEFNKETGALVR